LQDPTSKIPNTKQGCCISLMVLVGIDTQHLDPLIHQELQKW
jgi:hypothetical protein